MLFACDSNLNEVNKFNLEVNTPQGVAKNINLFFTDSGVVKANLKSPKMLDYSHEKYPYRIFPIGVEVDFFNSDSTKNTVIADSAIVHANSNLIDMRKNVKIITSDSLVLTTSQLYWDTAKQWVFTDRNYKIRLANGTENNGTGFDSDQEFTVFNSRTNTGIQVIEDNSL
ncbi:LPS export ABC transporter periplasmic protein LptC [Flavobacterium sp. CS20]|uniref:LPS export ABC transporter periplasmic protein LptC n=1 Tax=Flavobacterium sp. CS20 TaxID=2775246 RepID=UPI001B3A5493|nr:LPS export ABC transporter periplasmic protein LptC [Flavobacterium sp. CS20]QTY26373.1 LPS export ABC transporter periplasmic protein LptC [Flavobacterium sp. CS20]